LSQLITGKIPYHELSNDVQVLAKLFQGQLLPQPDDAHPQLWSLIQACWNRDPQARPSANEALDRIESIPSSPSDSETSATPWIFQWSHNIVPMPEHRDRDATLLLPVSQEKRFLSDEPELIIGRRSSAVARPVDRDDDGVEDFGQMLNQLDDQDSWTFVSPVPSLTSSINSDNYSYNPDDAEGTLISG
jgi:hypothetical protein